MNESRAVDDLPSDRREMIVTWAFARLDGRAFAAASAAIAAAFLFALTLARVIKGAPPGVPVGPHLAKPLVRGACAIPTECRPFADDSGWART